MTYAYVFLHRPADAVDPTEYAARLQLFHEALAASPPAGFHRSWSWRVEAGPLGAAVEDWYLVESWLALQTLSEAAVSGPRRAPHDGVAPLAGDGAGAVYRLLHGTPDPGHTHRIRWSKPGGTSYPDFEADLLAGLVGSAAVWQRQLVLGPDVEFLIEASSAGRADPRQVSPLIPAAAWVEARRVDDSGVFGVETRRWSQSTTASSHAVEAAFDAMVDPPLRTWLLPGALAPLARMRRGDQGRWLRLSPGDPRRGPGSLDRAYVTVRADGTGAVVDIAQRPIPLLGAILGAIVVGAWIAAILFALDGLVHRRPYELVGVLLAFGLRSFVELGRRCDERRLRQWLVAFTGAAPPLAARPRTVSYGPARFDVPAADCR